MKLFSILSIYCILSYNCSKTLSEKDLLNKADPYGHYGLEISNGEIIEIAELIKNSEQRLDKSIILQGIVSKVCPMRGCWVQVVDEITSERVRIKVVDGEIVFPLSAVGKNVIAEGIFVKMELNENQSKKWKKHLAFEEGIEIDTANITLTEKDLYEYRLNSKAAKIF